MTTAITLPSMDEFLRINPLPKNLAHLEPTLRKLPVSAMFGIICNGAALGSNDDEISEGLKQAAEFAEQKSHRCAACLRWDEEYHAIAAAKRDGCRIFALCVRCDEKIRKGRGTPAMRRNLQSYGFGEVQR